MRSEILTNRTKIFKAISILSKGGEPININRVSKITGLTWKTVKKYFENEFYLERI